MFVTPLVALVVLFLAVLVVRAGLLVRRIVRRWRGRPITPKPVTARCQCGYELDQLDTIRCPECGRVSGFDATAEDLSLTDDDLRRAKAKRDARRTAEDHA